MKHASCSNVFGDIQSLCKDFRRKLKHGVSARIEDYLQTVDEPSRQMLFQNLLHIDIEFRRRQGKSPSSEDYTARFPQYGVLIRQAFFESTMMTMAVDVETPAEEQTVVLGIPAARRLGEYELIRELGRGGFGVVYAAKHSQRGEVVALKTLPTGLGTTSHSSDDAERLHRFRQEFRALSEVNHPNLVGMQTLEVEANQWFITMDLVDGVDFLEYVRPAGRLNEQRLRETLVQLVKGIIALHEQGIVHRDLKPNNVLVDKQGHLILLDFGLVAELQRSTGHTISMCSQHFAGTPRYAAPEQGAGVRSVGADWYAMGVMLYEALTGEVPFTGSAVQLMVKKQTADAPQLVGRDGVPQDLAKLVDQLLKREPNERPDAAAICHVLGLDSDSASHDSTHSSLSSVATPTDALLIGRESQLGALEQARQSLLRNKQPLVVFVRGRSGEGKTSLVERFLEPLRRGKSMLVLSGRCYDRESVPFKAIDCIIDALVAYLRSRSQDDVYPLLPGDVHVLAHLFPVLRRVPAIADRAVVSIAAIDSRQIRYRAFAALRELLVTIGESTPIVMFIDDLQWGDADSATALFELLQPPDPPALMVLGSYRSDEAEESSFLQQWNRSCGSSGPTSALENPTSGSQGDTSSKSNIQPMTVEVSSLSEDQCLSLLAARLGMERHALRHQARELFEGTRGNPYFMEQLLEGFNTSTGEFQAVPLREIISRKLERLPGGAVSLLQAIAIAGQAVALEEVSNLAGRPPQAFATITHMRSERLVRFIGSDEQQLVDTYHDKVRETVTDMMSQTQRRQLHVQYGEHLERTETITAAKTLEYLAQDPATATNDPGFTDRIFDLAYHFHAAGDPRAFAYQLMAGELSYQAYASEDAVDFLKRAEQCQPPDLSDSLQFRIWQRLASSHARLRMLEPALELYGRALPYSPSALARAETYTGIAFANATLARHAAFVRNCNLALKELGAPRPSPFVALLKIFVMAVRILCLPRKKWRDYACDPDQAKRFLQLRVYGAQTYAFFETPGIDLYYAIMRMGSLAVSAANPRHFAFGMSSFAGVFTYIGWSAIAQRQLRRAEAVSRDISDAEMLGMYLMTSAVTKAGAGQTELAKHEFDESLVSLEKAGAHWLQTYCVHMQRHLQQFIGSSRREFAAAKKVLEIAEGIGDIRAQCWGQYDLAYAAARGGDLRTALVRIDRAQELLDRAEEASITESIFLASKGFVLLQASDYGAARSATEKSWEICKRKLLFMEFNSLSLPLLIQSTIGPEWHIASVMERKTLKRLLREARLLLLAHIALRSQIHRSRGRALWVLGKRKHAIRCFERAIRAAERYGADYDRARSLLDLAAVQEKGRSQLRREAVQLLKQQESVIPYAERWLLGDQQDETVVAPRPEEA